MDFFAEDEPVFEKGVPVQSKKEKFESNDAYQETPNFFKDGDTEVEEVIAKEEVEEKEEEIELSTEEVNKDLDVKAIEKATNKSKFIMAKDGDSELNLLPTTKFTQKVSGIDTEVTLQELLNDFSGREGYQKKFTALDKQNREDRADLDRVNKYIGEFATKSKSDPIAAFEYLAEMAGVNPLEFRRNLRKTFNEKFSEYQSMTEDQKNMYELREENEYFKREKEIGKQKVDQEQANKDFQGSIDEAQKTHNISDERLDSLAQDLRQHGGDKEVTLDNVIQLHKAYVIQDRVFDVLTKVNPLFVSDDEKFNTLESLLKGKPSMDDKQLIEFASKLWNSPENKAIENLKKKVVNKNKNIATTNEVHGYKSKLNSTGTINFF